MEHGASLGTWVAQGVIVLFLLLVCAALVRSLVLPLALVLLEIAQRSRRRREAAPPDDDEKDSPR